MKTFTKLAVALILTALVSCEKSVTDIPATGSNTHSSARTTARILTETRYAFAPSTYVSVYNQSSVAISVTFYYNNSTSSSSGWINGGTRTISARKDVSYCRLGVKQLKAVITFDANAGIYQFLSGKKYSCN